jgi:membrane-associated phospholipid phosphatase
MRRTIAAGGVIGDCGKLLEPGNLAKIGIFMPRLSWALIVSAATLVLFAGIAWQVQSPDSGLWQFDRDCADSMKEHAAEHPGWLHFFRDVTNAGGVPAMTVMAVVGALLLLFCERKQLALLWLTAAALGCVVNTAAKGAFDRARPDATLRDEAVTERNASFPSGHAMGSLIGYSSLGYVGTVLLRRRWAKVVLVSLLTVLVLLIGLSRIALRAHWCSDVIGGYAIGVCWMSVCIGVLGQRAPTGD